MIWKSAASKKYEILGYLAIFIAVGVILLPNLYTGVPDNSMTEECDQIRISVSINRTNPEKVTICRGENAYAAFSKLYTLETKDSRYGKYVVAVNGVWQGGGFYWMFYINDSLAPVGISSYKPGEGDHISISLEKLK